MRKRGSVSEFSAERDAALVKCFRRLLGKAMTIDLDRIFEEVAASRAPRFYVSETRARMAISHYLKHGEWDVKGSRRVKMYEEIKNRVDMLMEQDGGLDYDDALYEVINSPAPEFYLTPRSCRTLIYAASHKANVAAARRNL